jgi:hypothetical protein
MAPIRRERGGKGNWLARTGQAQRSAMAGGELLAGGINLGPTGHRLANQEHGVVAEVTASSARVSGTNATTRKRCSAAVSGSGTVAKLQRAHTHNREQERGHTRHL